MKFKEVPGLEVQRSSILSTILKSLGSSKEYIIESST